MIVYIDKQGKCDEAFLNTCGRIPDRCYKNDKSIERAIIKSRDVGVDAFRGCSSLREVMLPKTLYIGDRAFFDCPKLEYVYAPNIIKIGARAFFNCDSLKITGDTETLNWAIRRDRIKSGVESTIPYF